MNIAIRSGRRKGQAVLMADELRNLAVGFLEGFGVWREKDAAAGCMGDRQKAGIGSRFDITG